MLTCMVCRLPDRLSVNGGTHFRNLPILLTLRQLYNISKLESTNFLRQFPDSAGQFFSFPRVFLL